MQNIFPGLCVAVAAFGGSAFAVEPQFEVLTQVKQGFTLRMDVSQLPAGKNAGLVAEFLGKTVPLFPDGEGKAYGLAPVGVFQEPGEFPLVIRETGGKVYYQTRVTVLDGAYPEQNITTTRTMRSLKTSDDELKRMRAFRALVTPKKYWVEPFRRPTPECQSSPFGVKRLHDGKATGNFHAGLDLRSPKGRAVRATTAGVVKIARRFPRQGGTVGIDHGQGVLTTYIHLSKVVAKEGQLVKAGTLIGLVGSTGFSTGAHLHWNMSVHGVAVNPAQWSPGVGACR